MEVNEISTITYHPIPGNYILICGNETVTVPKDAMDECSGYTRSNASFVQHSNTIGNVSETNGRIITLNHLNGDFLQTVVGFVCNGNATISVDNIGAVYTAADYLDIPELLKLCDNFLKKLESRRDLLHNCVDALNVSAELVHLKGQMFERCYNFCVDNFLLLEKEQYTKICEELLLQLIRDDRLRVTSELQLVDVIRDWMEVNRGIVWYYLGGECYRLGDDGDALQQRRNHQRNVLHLNSNDLRHFDDHEDGNYWTTLSKFMSQIRWPLIGPDAIKGVAKYMLCQTDEYQEIVTEVKDYHSNTHKQPFKQSKRTQLRSHGPSLCSFDSTIGSFRLYNFKTGYSKQLCFPGGEAKRYVYVRILTVANFLYVCCYNGDVNVWFRYDPRFNVALELTSPVYRHKNFVFIYHDKKLFVIGGYCENRTTEEHAITEDFETKESITMTAYKCEKFNLTNMTNTTHITKCEEFNIQTNTWRTMKAYPKLCTQHAGCVVGDGIYISGGRDCLNKTTLNTVYLYDVTKTEWKECSGMSCPRARHVMECVGTCMYVIGGVTEYTWHYYDLSVERYSTLTNQWTVCNHVMTLRSAVSYVDNGNIYLVGNGVDYADTTDQVTSVRVFNEASDDMSDVTQLPYDVENSCGLLHFPHSSWYKYTRNIEIKAIMKSQQNHLSADIQCMFETKGHKPLLGGLTRSSIVKF